MKIATNAPFSFMPRGGYELLPLEHNHPDANMIVLMLQKNWGAASIENIRSITHCLSTYPRDLPCYIVGCETTIPDDNLTKYLHRERDDAIRDLCDEVLSRSKSIGVRGVITHRYLTEILGYKEDQVDIIYTKGHPNNSLRVLNFLKKNGCNLQLFVSDILAFQASPTMTYERSCSFDKQIIINCPYITKSETRARLNADVEIDGEKKTLWCETDILYSDFLLSERADAFLCVLLPFAMRSGRDILCLAPVTEQFLHNMSEVLIPHLCSHDNRLHRTKITATGDSSSMVNGGAVATGMSCGVDSFYTASLYKSSSFKSMNLTHLYVGNYLYGNDGAIYERASCVAEQMGLPLVRTSTNINKELPLPHVYTHFYKTMFGVLSLRKLLRVYYYSSAEDFSHFNLKSNATNDTTQSELLLLYAFSCPDLQIITGGAKSERVEKTRAICEFEVATKFVNVCLDPYREKNCGECGKCRRTLLTIDMLGHLEKFRDAFPIEEYLRNRVDSFVYLLLHKKSSYLAAVYQHFLQTEPSLIKQAENKILDDLERSRASVS